MIRFCVNWATSGDAELPGGGELPRTADQLRSIEGVYLRRRKHLPLLAPCGWLALAL